jgi:hypothetical protein
LPSVQTTTRFPVRCRIAIRIADIRSSGLRKTPRSRSILRPFLDFAKKLVGENKGRKAFSTRARYEFYLKLWILLRRGDLTINGSSQSLLGNGWTAPSEKIRTYNPSVNRRIMKSGADVFSTE